MGKERVLREEPLRLHTTLRIGGPADFLVKPESEEELSALLQCCKKNTVPHFILGNGSSRILVFLMFSASDVASSIIVLALLVASFFCTIMVTPIPTISATMPTIKEIIILSILLGCLLNC
ncbi:MAG: FAD-binding protein [Muribaculaceae bacterium]|nr:FAD-binding protein [Muribaculaceae bacterium]